MSLISNPVSSAAVVDIPLTKIQSRFSMTLYILAATTAATLLYGCILAIYRLFFHPLAKYPGPRLAALTDWYATFYAWRGDLHKKNRQWHDKYGMTVRFGPNALCFNSSTAMNDIYGVRANVRKSDGYASLSASRCTPNTVTTIDKGVHGFKRRIMAQVYTERSLKEIEDRILDNISDFVDVLGSESNAMTGWTAPKDIAQTCDWLTFDVISDLCYGEDFDMLHSSEMRWFPSVVRKIAQRSMMGLIQPKFFQLKLDTILLANQYKDIIAAGAWVRQRAEARAQLGNDIKKKDMFYTLMNAVDPKTGLQFTQKDLWVESMLLLAAAISAVIHYLLHHPTHLANLTRTLRTLFPTEASISFSNTTLNTEMETEAEAEKSTDTLLTCPQTALLRSCINESMRLAPSVSSAPPRTVLPGGLLVDGEPIPPGTTVGTSIYTIHRNEEYFDHPDEFDPLRWMDEDTEIGKEKVRRAGMGFAPFSVGARSCVGWRLAWVEMNVAIARVLWRFDMRLASVAGDGTGAGCSCGSGNGVGEKGREGGCDYEFMGWVTSSAEGPVVEFRRRDDLEM
ncbi:cytochrome P450 [Aspergillus heteromorphus CBS 117.55]|uniref:Cytochrome P450 n=1 Tax=Aspergillus heteromorphus CBS 117.55 TaxID=1448321 RepID=A0A317X896_9EURO|nr:cytochrome P450 [Aspergillus heteromorphus CBS 117.55]PWY92800.1 cytochrome P450 [Aspergillus heteromorphus CBS 117.55]